MDTSQNRKAFPLASPRKRRNVLRNLAFSGFIMLVVGVLAFVIAQMLYTSGSGDTTDAWVEGFTALCCGIPLMSVGAGVVIIAFIITAVRHVRSTKQATRLTPEASLPTPPGETTLSEPQ